jgi:Protein of unknown function (DUF4232)
VIGDRVHVSAAAVALVVLLAGCARPVTETSTGTVEAADGVSVSVAASSSPGTAAGPLTTAAGCPPEGVRVQAGTGDAAMGLRVLGITLTNCGKRAYPVEGYPVLRALDEDRSAFDVQVLNGANQILHTDQLPWDGPPVPIVLQPGQQAGVGIAWRNTYDDTRNPPVNVKYLEIAPVAGRPVQVIAPDGGLDLGSTGRIAVSAWQLEPSGTASPSGGSAVR